MRVLIADDEAAVHEQMKKAIPWVKLGWTIVGHAANGEEARRLTEVYRPQLILTDIKMPLMDGLAFISWLKTSGIPSEVIVLSGYGDLAYSRPAFLHGAFDYLLKPVNEAELLRVLSHAVDKIREDSNAKVAQIKEKAVLQEGLTVLQDEYLTQTSDAAEADENELYVQAAEKLIRLPESGFYAVIVKLFDMDERVSERFDGDRQMFYFAIRNIIKETLAYFPCSIVYRQLSRSNEYVVLFDSPSRQSAERLQLLLGNLQRALVHYMRIRVKLGVSAFKHRIVKLPDAYREGVLALEAMRLHDGETVGQFGASRTLQESGSQPIWKEIDLLFTLLLEGSMLRDNQQLLQKLEAAFSEETLGQTSGLELKLSLSHILDRIASKNTDQALALMIGEGKQKLNELKLNQMKALLLRMAARLFVLSASEPRMKSGKPLIDLIKAYMRENYKTLSLEEIAQTFFINKNYFCSLYKQVTGDSFMDDLTAVRVEQAKRLLEDSELRAYEIAEQVGYKDQRYFSQVFKKATGLQPTQYRQQRLSRS